MIKARMFSIATVAFAFSITASSSAQNLTDKGKIDCEYGSADCNRCAYNVRDQFKSLQRNPDGRFKFNTGAGETLAGLEGPMLPISEVNVVGLGRNKGHVQSFSRLSGIGDNDWFVLSLDSQPKDVPDNSRASKQTSGLLFVQMANVASNNKSSTSGHKLSVDGQPDQFFTSTTHPRDTARFYFPIISETNGKNSKHPSGFQSVGQIIPVPAYGNGEHAYVQFVLPTLKASSDNAFPKGITAIFAGQLRLKDIGWEPHKNAGKVFAGAGAKLSNNRNLLILLRSDYGHLQYYLSTPTSWGAAQWTEHRVDDTTFSRYQNMALVTDCGSGDLYLIGLKWLNDRIINGIEDLRNFDGPWDGDSKADLYKVRLDDKGRLDTSRKLETVLFDEADESCEAKGGSGAYVTVYGRLIIYCSQGRSVVKKKEGRDWQTLRFTEFVAQSPIPNCPSLEKAVSKADCDLLIDDERLKDFKTKNQSMEQD